MSIYNINLDKYSSVYFVASPDEYELEVIKPSMRLVEVMDKVTQLKSNKPVISYLLRIISGVSSGEEYKDKPVTVDFWMSDEQRDWDNLIRFFSACKGIRTGNDEADNQTRSMLRDLDFSIDSENSKLGSGFSSFTNARVRCNLTSTVAKNDPNKMYQKFGTFLPL